MRLRIENYNKNISYYDKKNNLKWRFCDIRLISIKILDGGMVCIEFIELESSLWLDGYFKTPYIHYFLCDSKGNEIDHALEGITSDSSDSSETSETSDTSETTTSRGY